MLHVMVLVMVAGRPLSVVAPLKWRGLQRLKFVAAAAVSLLTMWADAPQSLYATRSCVRAVVCRAAHRLAWPPSISESSNSESSSVASPAAYAESRLRS